MLWRLVRISTIALVAIASFVAVGADDEAGTSRASVIRRAQVWKPADIARVNFAQGPPGPGAFAPGETVRCKYLEKQLSGNSPKFACLITPDDEVKVKFGGTNGEVYAELLASRLLWALGFGADRMYRVNVICDRCPREFAGISLPDGSFRFSPALIERKADGGEWSGEGGSGWAWPELESIDPEAGGAPRHHRDALKLLAVMLQHTDNKPQQQRLLCLGASRDSQDGCRNPFLMISDVGLTFGRATFTNSNAESSANLAGWSRTPVWRDPQGCVGNLRKSITGSLEYPVITEAGRAFLAGLLGQLSDRQLHDLFDSALLTHRLREPAAARSGFPANDEWVRAFKDKRQQIVDRRCA
jgi:hypothetical protein